MSPEKMAVLLQGYISQTFTDLVDPQVSQLENLNSGWESDVYAYVLESGLPGQRDRIRQILRIYPGGGAAFKAALEFNGMQQLFRDGYPVPQVLRIELDHSPFVQPFIIMEAIEGVSMWPVMFHSPTEQQQMRLEQFVELFVRLHQLDWRAYTPYPQHLTESPIAPVEAELEIWRQALGEGELGLPGFTPVFNWLEQRKGQVRGAVPAVVHRDFHPNNILICPDGRLVVIDWTQIGVSDARYDLAWALLLLGTYEGTEWRERILREYERQVGHSLLDMDFFEVAACAKRLFSMVFSVQSGAEKMGMRPGAENIIRQETEHIQRVYEVLRSRCDVVIPEVEALVKGE